MGQSFGGNTLYRSGDPLVRFEHEMVFLVRPLWGWRGTSNGGSAARALLEQRDAKFLGNQLGMILAVRESCRFVCAKKTMDHEGCWVAALTVGAKDLMWLDADQTIYGRTHLLNFPYATKSTSRLTARLRRDSACGLSFGGACSHASKARANSLRMRSSIADLLGVIIRWRCQVPFRVWKV